MRGLNDNHNKDLKSLFKSAAISASTRPGPLHDFYVARVEKGMRPTMARLTLARKMATITLTIWKKGVSSTPNSCLGKCRLSLSGEAGFPSREFPLMMGGRFWRCSVREEYQSMRSAPCASAPSHPLHVMPPRITRNSHRPRASDRTMVASEATSSRLPLFRTRWHRYISGGTYEHGNRPNLPREVNRQVGWISRKNLHSGRGGAFFS